ncbi:cyclin-U1-1-like isoform X2 [Glycine soja]|uniref:cyclin-U1-1-like isoform X2 n=1 Tax=Glycine soja TaxID=3848 RepID=UPI00103B761D|nr:cyclin-U1-1-like isoform X2 [Glycine soja]
MLTAGDYSNHGRPLQPETSLAELNLPRVLCVLSSMLEKLVARNEKLIDILSQELDGLNSGSVRLGNSLNTFHGVRAPSISIPKYLERIYKYTNCSPSCFVVGYVYIDRHYNNAIYARVGGVSNAELNKLELELLFLLDFRVMVSSRVFESYCFHLEKEMVVNGTGMKIERALTPKAMDDLETEISIEDKQSPSPPQIVE